MLRGSLSLVEGLYVSCLAFCLDPLLCFTKQHVARELSFAHSNSNACCDLQCMPYSGACIHHVLPSLLVLSLFLILVCANTPSCTALFLALSFVVLLSRYRSGLRLCTVMLLGIQDMSLVGCLLVGCCLGRLDSHRACLSGSKLWLAMTVLFCINKQLCRLNSSRAGNHSLELSDAGSALSAAFSAWQASVWRRAHCNMLCVSHSVSVAVSLESHIICSDLFWAPVFVA